MIDILKRTKTKKFDWKELASELGAVFDGKYLTGTVDGHPYKVEYGQGSRNAPGHLKLSVYYPFPHPMTIRKETGFDRFTKRIGLAVEVDTGDEPFDDAYYVDTPVPEFARTYLASDEYCLL